MKTIEEVQARLKVAQNKWHENKAIKDSSGRGRLADNAQKRMDDAHGWIDALSWVLEGANEQ